MSNILNKIKDGYLAVVDWVELHPHAALWITTGVLIVALVF